MHGNSLSQYKITMEIELRNLFPLILASDDSLDEDESAESEREEKKVPYLDFAKREARGETVNRSILQDAEYDESGKLVSGKLPSVPSDFNAEIHRTPGRKFWADELDLVSLKIAAYDAKIAALAETRQELQDTLSELKKLGTPAERALAATNRRLLGNAFKSLAKSGINMTPDEMMKRFLEAKNKMAASA